MSANKKNISNDKIVLKKALIRTVAILNIKQKELSEILGLSPAEISRILNKDSYPSPKTKAWECIIFLIRIYKSLDTLLGENEQQCRDWFHYHNHYLGGKPIQLIKKIDGLVDVTLYLDTMRGLA